MKKLNNGKQKGFTLIELMVGIIILSILGAVFFVTTNTDKSKATAILTNATKTGNALQLSKADIPCYPSANHLDILNDGTKANIAANMDCGIPAGPNWKGPYLNGATFTAGGVLDLTTLVQGSTVNIMKAANVTNVGNTDWFLTIAGLPSNIESELVAACGGKCQVKAPLAPSGAVKTWSVYYKFDETR